MKSVKNETELHNIEQAHIKDGVAVTRFMHWLKTHVGISSESVSYTHLDVYKRQILYCFVKDVKLNH